MSETRKNNYQLMKPSGIEWIGDIPEHWGTKRLKFVSNVQSSNVDKKSFDNETEVLLCNYVDVYYNDFIDDEISFMRATAKGREIEKFILNEHDVLITKDSETPDDIANPAFVTKDFENVLCGYHLAQIKPDKYKLNGKYLFRLFQSKEFNSYFEISANGVTRYGLPLASITGVFISLPTLPEQTAIADYLDEKTEQIDKLIANKGRLIELLKEERTAIINDAVTGKLSIDNCQLTIKKKPSGIDWLGDIPEHWDVKKLKFLGNCQNGVSEGSDYFGSGFPFVSYGDVYKNSVLPSNIEGLANSSTNDRRRYSVLKDDIFFTRTSETIEEIGIASTCLKTIKNATFSGFLIRFRPEKNIFDIHFAKYYFRSQIQRVFFVKEMNLVTRASLSQELLKRLPVMLPSSSEQNEIANFLDDKTNEIDSTISKIEREIELIKEYRTALISEVVTGKIKVVQI